MEMLRATSSRTLCPWKGIANYWTVEVDGMHAKNAAWGYRHPSPLARRVKGRVAFWKGVAVHADRSEPTHAQLKWSTPCRRQEFAEV